MKTGLRKQVEGVCLPEGWLWSPCCVRWREGHVPHALTYDLPNCLQERVPEVGGAARTGNESLYNMYTGGILNQFHWFFCMETGIEIIPTKLPLKRNSITIHEWLNTEIYLIIYFYCKRSSIIHLTLSCKHHMCCMCWNVRVEKGLHTDGLWSEVLFPKCLLPLFQNNWNCWEDEENMVILQ